MYSEVTRQKLLYAFLVSKVTKLNEVFRSLQLQSAQLLFLWILKRSVAEDVWQSLVLFFLGVSDHLLFFFEFGGSSGFAMF